MIPKGQYTKRIQDFSEKTRQLQKLEDRLSAARLITFLTSLVLLFSLITFSVSLAVVLSVGFMVAFGWLVKKHSRIENEKNFYSHLTTINELELRCLNGDFAGFEPGIDYMNHEHPYTFDLDIFGNASLFQYINRTTSKPAADLLASWLKEPADLKEIYNRQKAILELKPRIEWRQKLLTIDYTHNNTGRDPGELLEWTKKTGYFNRPETLKLFAFGLSTITIVCSVFSFFGFPLPLLMLVLLINFIFYFSQAKKIGILHNQVSRYADMLSAYSATIQMIETESFESEKLKALHHQFIGNIPASGRIRQLSKLVSRLDTRMNVMVSIPLNAFLFWDIHCCLAMENWKQKNRDDIAEWIKAMAEFEVICCMANMAFNNPEWVLPKVVPEYFILKADQAGHPLIPADRRIYNSIEIPDRQRTILITGSNMSGKSTFLRTCGVNAVLALAGSPVCAAFFSISHVKIFSSMRITDSLEDNTSSFYAELKKLATIIREAERNPNLFLLLDEILRGTNSNDRYTGSVALLKQLIGYKTVAMVATHDLKLADLASESDRITNYHFDVKIEGEELYFDYKLNSGICKSLNASILMKKMGIKV